MSVPMSIPHPHIPCLTGLFSHRTRMGLLAGQACPTCRPLSFLVLVNQLFFKLASVNKSLLEWFAFRLLRDKIFSLAVAHRSGWPKNGNFWYALTSSNINRSSKLFHYQNQEKICNNTVTKDRTTPQVCRYTTL